MSTLGDFCGSTLGDFMGSALVDRGCEPESCFGCSFLPHTFSVKLSGISGFLVRYQYGAPAGEPFDLSVFNRNYSISVPAWYISWTDPTRCSSSGLSPYIGPLPWYSTVYVRCRLQLDYLTTHDGNQITARLRIGIDPLSELAFAIKWSITLPWTEDDCCHGIGRNLPMVAVSSFGYLAYDIRLSPGTGDGSICTIMS